MNDPGFAPRAAAHALLMDVTADGRLLSEAMPQRLSRLSPEDRARAQRLAVVTLRHADRADRMLKPFLERRTPLFVRNLLRMGTVEIWQEAAAAHGVVNAMVEIAGRDAKSQGMKGLVNAVLRRISEERPGAWGRVPVSRLPDWLRAPLIEAWGKATVAGIEASHAAGPALDLTPRHSEQAEALAASLGGTVLPTGSVRVMSGAQVSALPGYDDGAWWVQDAAAALPARLLAPGPGEAVLDLCAAPGGKTLQLAAAGARVTAVDISAARLERLTQNLARTGLVAETVVSDVKEFAVGGWSAILLDAPCSATGTIRRHPDLPHARDGAEIGALIDEQAALIDHAIGLLAPGGRLVFCTCSLIPDEGEVQITEALARHPGLSVDSAAAAALRGCDPSWLSPEGGIRTRPDHWAEIGGLDGFYMAVIRKAA